MGFNATQSQPTPLTQY
uniref:Uncharacterized protein n=1 Tax=Rhizophora mucronata TaxID=61149 RepID=A0A2P2QET2_RHIMU